MGREDVWEKDRAVSVAPVSREYVHMIDSAAVSKCGFGGWVCDDVCLDGLVWFIPRRRGGGCEGGLRLIFIGGCGCSKDSVAKWCNVDKGTDDAYREANGEDNVHVWFFHSGHNSMGS